MVGGQPGHINSKMIELSVLGEAWKTVSRTATLDFQGADFGLFRDLIDRVHWEVVLNGKGVQEDWTFIRNEILKAQKQAIYMC